MRRVPGTFGLPRQIPGMLVNPIVFSDTERYGRDPRIPRGAGMSYNQASLLAGGLHIGSRHLDQFLNLDLVRNTGSASAGIPLNHLLSRLSIDRRTLAAVPGSGMITLGGAVAADAHGKNHHRVGSIGNWITEIELWRSDERVVLGPGSPLFNATIGGLGSTGFIARVDFKLQVLNARSVFKHVEPFDTIDEAIELESVIGGGQYTAAWVDLAIRPGSGLFFEASEMFEPDDPETAFPVRPPRFNLPPLPNLAGHMIAKCVAWAYRATNESGREALDRFLWPLDRVGKWNRLYGSSGISQFQCVIPHHSAKEVLKAMVNRIVESKVPAPLAVLKRFGDVEPVGLLSFPMPGFTLAVDFPRGHRGCDQLVDELESMTADAGGRVYLVKSDRLNPRIIKAGYPRVAELLELRDPVIHSPVIDALVKTCSAF